MNAQRLTAMIAALTLFAGVATGCEKEEAETAVEAVAEQEPVEDEVTEKEAKQDLVNAADGEIAPFPAADLDDDGEISKTELETWEAKNTLFTDWDEDGDAKINDEESGRQSYAVWDIDEDGVINEVEWGKGIERWFEDGDDRGSFADWDANDDAQLSAEEFVTQTEKAALFTDWDGDGNAVINDSEFNTRVRAIWDLDGDGVLNETEWDAGPEVWVDVEG